MQRIDLLMNPLGQPTENQTKKKFFNRKGSANYFILAAIVVFCLLLSFLGFPLWMVLIFGLGMSSILFLLYVIRGIQMVLNTKEKELEDGNDSDLFL